VADLRRGVSIEDEIAADWPGDEILAALRSRSPAQRKDRRGTPPQEAPGGPGRALSTDQVIRAYAATLAPDDDGTAWIYPGDLAQFAAAHNWAGPARRPRQALLAALARLADRGALDRRPGRASYKTRPPGYAACPDPVIAGEGIAETGHQVCVHGPGIGQGRELRGLWPYRS
jgi:hypothetical protein